ncbi:DUF2061 domain-containing protein [Variovorax sp. J22R115]|uniref:DUF2061 domain-containing protein n=1 Tax=Variovorax sp. J22R115 TaxID=3053509 RepID=UPI0030151687
MRSAYNAKGFFEKHTVSAQGRNSQREMEVSGDTASPVVGEKLQSGLAPLRPTFAVTYLLTGDWLVSGAVALIEPCVNTVAFYFHELFWATRKERQEAGLAPLTA